MDTRMCPGAILGCSTCFSTSYGIIPFLFSHRDNEDLSAFTVVFVFNGEVKDVLTTLHIVVSRLGSEDTMHREGGYVEEGAEGVDMSLSVGGDGFHVHEPMNIDSLQVSGTVEEMTTKERTTRDAYGKEIHEVKAWLRFTHICIVLIAEQWFGHEREKGRGRSVRSDSENRVGVDGDMRRGQDLHADGVGIRNDGGQHDGWRIQVSNEGVAVSLHFTRWRVQYTVLCSRKEG